MLCYKVKCIGIASIKSSFFFTRRLDSNKLQFLPNGCLEHSPRLVAVKLDKNPWHCDCKAIYLARLCITTGKKSHTD